MKVEWDYTPLAKSYLKRPDYSDQALSKLFDLTKILKGMAACDVGAGVAHLTLKLLDRGLKVTAVEPNDEMRKYGIERTRGRDVCWHAGTGENTGQEANKFDIVTFGSSFNVTDRDLALKEARRISKDNGWFAAMWNHRDLSDPVQDKIEGIIKSNINGYDYGVRRQNQEEFLRTSNYFYDICYIEGRVEHTISVQDAVEAWMSHGTLHRQAGPEFDMIIDLIKDYLESLGRENITIPYTTRVWAGQFIKE